MFQRVFLELKLKLKLKNFKRQKIDLVLDRNLPVKIINYLKFKTRLKIVCCNKEIVNDFLFSRDTNHKIHLQVGTNENFS